MATAIIAAPATLTRHRFTVAEYDRMGETGILGEDDRVELIAGEIVEMSPIGYPHAACVNRLTMLLVPRVGSAAIVSIQNPIRLGEYYEPQPDVTLLRPREDFYAHGGADPADVLLVIEVADSSVGYDRGVKVPLYAEAGIAEYWLVDLARETIETYRRPVNGTYQETATVGRDGTVSAAGLPGLALPVAAILG